jgi:hypothetical protein
VCVCVCVFLSLGVYVSVCMCCIYSVRSRYIKFHEVWAQQEAAILTRGEELKLLKEQNRAQKAHEGGQMKSLSWVSKWA